MEGAHTWPLQEGGRQQAIDTLNAEISNDSGKIHNVKHILQEWIDDIETLSQEYDRVGDYLKMRMAE